MDSPLIVRMGHLFNVYQCRRTMKVRPRWPTVLAVNGFNPSNDEQPGWVIICFILQVKEMPIHHMTRPARRPTLVVKMKKTLLTPRVSNRVNGEYFFL